MRIFLSILTMVFSALIIILCYIWTETNTIDQFTNVFKSLYGGIPALSVAAFSIGKFWYIAPTSFLAMLVSGFVNKQKNPFILLSTLFSAIGFLIMLYAMYPLHLMFGTSII